MCISADARMCNLKYFFFSCADIFMLYIVQSNSHELSIYFSLYTPKDSILLFLIKSLNPQLTSYSLNKFIIYFIMRSAAVDSLEGKDGI